MYNIVSTYKNLYDIKKVKSKNIKPNSIAFIFFDNLGNYYLIKNNLVEYSSSLSLSLVSIISNIERISDIKILNRKSYYWNR